jgi:hypothetical protein
MLEKGTFSILRCEKYYDVKEELGSMILIKAAGVENAIPESLYKQLARRVHYPFPIMPI